MNMIFFYDLETTGLHYVNKKIDIIDRHFEEYTTEIVPSSGLLKPVMVPFIPFEITKLTGITKEMVVESGDRYEQFVREMKDIMDYCFYPIFISHNGENFDQKIMIQKNLLQEDKVRLLDSRMIIRLFLNHREYAEKSLSEIFGYLFKFVPASNRAQSDVKMLISIFKKLDITEDKIIKMV